MKTKNKLLSIMLIMLVIGTCIPLTSAMSDNGKNKEMEYIQNLQINSDENLIYNFQSLPFLKIFITFLITIGGFFAYQYFFGGPDFPPGYHSI